GRVARRQRHRRPGARAVHSRRGFRDGSARPGPGPADTARPSLGRPGSAAPALVRFRFVDLDEQRLLGPHGQRDAAWPPACGTGDLDERGTDVARTPPVVEIGDGEAGGALAALVWIALAVPRRHGRISIIPLFDVARVEATLGTLEGVTPDEAKRIARQRSFTFNGKRTAILFTIRDDLYLYDLPTHRAARLTHSPGQKEEASLSPDDSRAAFVRGNNLYVVDVATKRERALTSDGSPDVLNGKLDWVYQEEIYGRGTFRAYWWSPDSRRIAFLQLGEKAVPRYSIVDDIPYHPEPEVYPYPKAGDPNPAVRLGVVPSTGGAPRWIDTSRYGREHLICDVSWTPDSRHVVFQVQDREQTWLDLDFAGGDEPLRTVIKETSKAWVDDPG